MITPTLLPVVLLTAGGPSFDCAKARTEDEKLVCADPELAALDLALAGKYAARMRSAAPATAAGLRESQRAWLAERASCTKARGGSPPPGRAAAIRCLATSYEWRGGDLEVPREPPKLPPGLVERQILSRDPMTEELIEVWYPALAADRPGAAAFNAFFEKEADARVARWRTDSRAEAVDGPSLHAAFTVPLATARLVTIVTVGDIYAKGGAHPLPFGSATTFDLERGRPVALADVFAKGPGIASVLFPVAMKRLPLEEEEEPEQRALTEKAAREVLGQAGSWTFVADGAVVTFPPYSVGPYAMGSPEVRFTWQELMAHLKPGAPLPPR